jgi:hypothetical protein
VQNWFEQYIDIYKRAYGRKQDTDDYRLKSSFVNGWQHDGGPSLHSPSEQCEHTYDEGK